MIGYINLGTNDLPRAAAFYDALLALLGAKRFLEMERSIAWSNGGTGLVVCKPFDGKTATVGNGVMVALAAGSNENVDALHRKALELGGRDEGAPGPRGTAGFYGAYFRDPDGNKLCAFHLG